MRQTVIAGEARADEVDRADLARIVKRVGRSRAAEALGCSRPGVDYFVHQKKRRLPPEKVHAFLELDALPPMSPSELSRILGRLGGVRRAAPHVGVNAETLYRWRSGRTAVPYAFLVPLRMLWQTPAYQPEVGSPPLPIHTPGTSRLSREARGRCVPMAVGEFLEYVAFFGGVRPMSQAMGCGLTTLYRYAKGAVEVAPALGFALRRLKAEGRLDPAARLDVVVAYQPGENLRLLDLRRRQFREAHPDRCVRAEDRVLERLRRRRRPVRSAVLARAMGLTRHWVEVLLGKLRHQGRAQALWIAGRRRWEAGAKEETR